MYSVNGFLEKNRDTLPVDIVVVLRTSENKLLQQLFSSPLTKIGTLLVLMVNIDKVVRWGLKMQFSTFSRYEQSFDWFLVFHVFLQFFHPKCLLVIFFLNAYIYNMHELYADCRYLQALTVVVEVFAFFFICFCLTVVLHCLTVAKVGILEVAAH